MTLQLQARVVFPVDGPPIDGGVVTIDRERIVAVGAATDVTGERADLGDVALLPGLVNAHTHLEFSDLPRPLGEPGMRLVDWLPMVVAERRRRRDEPAEAIAAGCRESLAAGVTAIGEIATCDASAYVDCCGVDATRLVEVIGFSRARAVSAFAAAVERLEKGDRSILVAADVGSSNLGVTVVDQSPFSLGVSPHAPYSVSPDLVRRLVALARERGMPVAMHLAESEDELELLASGTGRFRELLEGLSMWDADAIPLGSRPLDYLKLLADAPRSLVIHGNYLRRDEHAFLAEHADRMTLVYCPRTHAYFAHPPYPLNELLAAGVAVAIGTDSRASNPDLSLLAELRFVARHYPNVAPRDVLQLGTLAGARALGCERESGSLTPGKAANLVAVPLPPGTHGRANELLAAVLASDAEPCAVWLRGRQV